MSWRCPNCGGKFDVDHIPADVRERAERAGIASPNWYAGRLVCPYPAALPRKDHDD